MALTGLGWTFVCAARGRTAISKWSAPAVVAHAQVSIAVDECVEAAIKRIVPRGADVWPVAGTDYYWSFTLGQMAGPYHHVLKDPRAGAYSLEAYGFGPHAPPGVVCVARRGGKTFGAVLVVRKL